MARIKTEQVVVVSRRRLAYMDIVGFGSRSSDVRLTNCGVEQGERCIFSPLHLSNRIIPLSDAFLLLHTHLLPFPNVAQLKSNLFTHIINTLFF